MVGFRSRAHPRSRGENVGHAPCFARRRGSSPLTRGKQTVQLAVGEASRLIPAHAGKTPSRSSARPGNAAHPRSRGENHLRLFASARHLGSSPLTRGKRRQVRPRSRSPRLIPAHAGKTAGPKRGLTGKRAHPRSRGENWVTRPMMLRVFGSSPLTRGKLAGTGALTEDLGLIPAHAGKTLPDLRFYRADRSDLGKP